MKSALLSIALACCSLVVAQNQDATFVNGVDGYINVPASPSLIPATGITLEAWVFFNNTGLNPTNLYPTIARKNVANGQEEYFFRVQGTGALRWKIKISATISLTIDSPTPMVGGVWTHVAGTYNGTTARLYINGVQVAQTNGAGTPFNGGGDLRIGKGDDQAGSPSEVWSGMIDEVRIWSVARTASQIQSTMSWQLPSIPNLVSSWQMSGNGLDSVGSNHGTVVGTVTFGASALTLNTGPAPWQVNQPEMSLDVDGVSSDGFSPAIIARTFTACAPALVTVNLSSTITGSPWDIGITVGPGVAGGSGGFFTTFGQAVNLSLVDPTLTFLNFPNPSPPLSSVSIPVAFAGPFDASAQGFAISGMHPDGFVLSSLFELHVTQGVATFPGPTLDNSVVTFSLANPAFCGPAAMPFYSGAYTQFDVVSNGRIMFGSPTPDTSFTPTVAAALTGYPFVGPWCDLSPNFAGSITISVPATGIIRVDWIGVRYWLVLATATFGIQLDANTGIIVIDGLGGISPAPPSQFLGMSAGILGPATNAGATTFTAGGPFATASAYDMIYAFGTAGSLTPGLTAIIFVPSFTGGYDWAAF